MLHTYSLAMSLVKVTDSRGLATLLGNETWDMENGKVVLSFVGGESGQGRRNSGSILGRRRFGAFFAKAASTPHQPQNKHLFVYDYTYVFSSIYMHDCI